MAKVSSFAITLDKATPIYYPSESVSGKLSYKVTERLKVTQVGLVAIGDAYCSWDDSGKSKKKVDKPADPKKSKKKDAKAEDPAKAKKKETKAGNEGYELFYKFENVFVTKKKDEFIEPGEYAHDFRIYLPPVLPPSYENPNARIRYEFIGTIQLDGEPSLHTKKTIAVSSHLDLNQIPGVGQPSVTSQSEAVGYCCKTGPVEATLATRKSGFVPGEMIVVDITIDNHLSKKTLSPPVINFVESVQLFSSNKAGNVTRIISSLTLPREIGPNSIEEYNGLFIEVPSICPTLLSSTKVFKLGYYIKLEFDSTKSPKIISDLLIPVIIGTNPINDYYTQIPPYVYQASVFGPNQAEFMTDKATKGQVLQSDSNVFIPYYPFYQLPSAPPRPLTPLITTPSSPTPLFTPRIASPLAITSDRAGFDNTVHTGYESLTPIYISMKPNPEKDMLTIEDRDVNKLKEPIYVSSKKPAVSIDKEKATADVETQTNGTVPAKS